MSSKTAKKLTAYDLTLERLVLAAGMHSSAACKVALDSSGLMPEHFYTDAHATVWAAILGLFIEDKSTDPTSVAAVLEQHGKVDDIGGLRGLVEIYTAHIGDIAFTPQLVDRLTTHCDRIKELAAARLVHLRATVLEEKARGGANPLELADFLRETADEVDAQLARVDDDDEYRLNDLRRLGAQPYDWVIEDSIERGDVFMVTAGSGAGKSLFSLQAAIQCNCGVNPFNPTKQRMARQSVMYVQIENDPREEGRRIDRMLWQQAERMGVDHDRFVAIMPRGGLNLASREGMARFRQLIYKHRPDIVFLCPWKDLHGGLTSQGDGGEASFMKVKVQLDMLRRGDPRTGRKGFALWIEAHTTGGADGSSNPDHFKPRGTVAQVNWVTYGMALVPAKNDDDVLIAGTYRFAQWRGPRDRERTFPHLMLEGSPWPWMPSLAITDLAGPVSAQW
jgi:hypothetical protein